MKKSEKIEKKKNSWFLLKLTLPVLAGIFIWQAVVFVKEVRNRLEILEFFAMEEMEKRQNAEVFVSELQNFVDGKPSSFIFASDSIRVVKILIAEAKEIGVPVSDLEAKVSDLEPKAWRVCGERFVSEFQEPPNEKIFGSSIADRVSSVKLVLAGAEKAGVDVSDLRKIFLESKSKVGRAFGEKALSDFRNFVEKGHTDQDLIDIEVEIISKELANVKKETGADISDLEEEFRKLEAKLRPLDTD